MIYELLSFAGHHPVLAFLACMFAIAGLEQVTVWLRGYPPSGNDKSSEQ